MVGYPRQHFRVEMVDPALHRTALTKAEERVLEGGIHQIGGLDRAAKPKALALPGVEGQPSWVGHPVEAGGLRKIIPGDMTVGGDCGKWIAIDRFARKRGKHASIYLRRA